MDNEDFRDESDSSDEDYVPDGKQEEILSEVDSDDAIEDPVSDSEQKSNKVKRRKKPGKPKKKQKVEKQEVVEEKIEEVEEKKAKVDDLWADFIKDTGFKSKNDKNGTSVSNSKNSGSCSKKTNEAESSQNKVESTKVPGKVKVTQIFEFAGEEVRVEKEVEASSLDTRLDAKTDKNVGKLKKSGGLTNVLSQLGKKQKISTLEKTKLDWDKFKKDENIEEELQTYNKGKDGYLDRQDFLQRADLRRFEIEKEIRSVERSKRFNSTL